jgi:RNA exonuclease 1
MINQSQRLRQLREKQNRPGSNSTTTTENQARRRILDSLPPHSPGSGHQTRVRHVLLSLPKLKPNPPTGDQSRMYSALSTVFQGPISGEEKKTHRSPTSLYALLFPTEYPVTPPLVARAVDKDSSSYLLSLQQMPSYTADIFDKADGWVATPQPVSQSILLLTYERQRSQVYAVISISLLRALLNPARCLTEYGKELIRVCIINNESGIVVYDKLFEAPKPIIDYLTE